MKSKKKIPLLTAIVILGLFVYLFLFGKLFPYSPVILGFDKTELAHTVIYSQKDLSFHDFASIDSLIPPVEKFHELKFPRKPEIVLFADSLSYLRHSPSQARFCAFYNGRVLVTPWALRESLEGKISLKIYLTHELSHALLHQHSGIFHAMRYPKWLLEGIAVYSADQLGTSFYPSKEETYAAIRRGNFMPPDFFKTKKEDQVKLDVPLRIAFMYSEFACIVDDLIETYGKEKLLVFMKSLLKDSDLRWVFKQIYGLDFDQFIEHFKEHVLEINQPNYSIE